MQAEIARPLRVHQTNPRYFADVGGRAVLLTGSHTWTVLQDAGRTFPPPRFDYGRWIRWLEAKGHSFFRMWAWENARWSANELSDFWFDPLPYARRGPGTALDGRARFDLTRFDESYFNRLHQRVGGAAERGIYTAVMLFQGWSVEHKMGPQMAPPPGRNPWPGHPFHRDNNINGIDGDPAVAGHGMATHTLAIPEITELQRAYVRRVVEAVGEFDNVLYEVTNEDTASDENAKWQDAIIEMVHDEEERAGVPRHPALITNPCPSSPDYPDALYANAAEAISPNSPANQGSGLEDYSYDPPASDGRKVIISDTDHIWGLGGDATWVWRSVMRGHNPIFMDPWEMDFLPRTDIFSLAADHPFNLNIRDAMGVARELASRIDLADLQPRGDRVSTRFALAADDLSTILAYSSRAEPFTIDLSGATGTFAAEWIHPTSGLDQRIAPVPAGNFVLLTPPFHDGAVLVLAKTDG